VAAFAAARGREGVACLAVSADAGDGLGALRARLADLLPGAAELAAEPEPGGVVVHRLHAAGEGFTLERDGDGFVVRGKRIERLAAQTNFEVEESAERFQRDLDASGSTKPSGGPGCSAATRCGSGASSSSGARGLGPSTVSLPVEPGDAVVPATPGTG